MATPGKKNVNINMASSAQGLKEELETIAKMHATSVSKVAARIYTYAVENMGSFPKKIEEPREKPGKHISSQVAGTVADRLTEWALDLDRSRAHHCCFILECVVNDEALKDAIFG